MAKITDDNIIMIFMDMECFKEVEFKYSVGSNTFAISLCTEECMLIATQTAVCNLSEFY